MHSESGFFRCPGGGTKVECIISHPNGMAEIEQGEVKGQTITLTSTSIQRTSSAAPPFATGIQRIFTLRADGVLHYTVDMSTSTQPLQRHLEAELRKIESHAANL